MFVAEIISARRPARKASGRVLAQPAPTMESGDRLTSLEFMRRYESMPEVKKAQLIEGVVYMSSPVRSDVHAIPDGLLHGWLFTYSLAHDGLKLLPNATLLLDLDNAPQPDAMLCWIGKKGDQVWLNDKGYLCGKPQLVCEVAASTAAIDMHDKLRAYRRNGIQEYLVWLVQEQKVVWYKLTDNGYEPLKETGGKLRSEVFPGLVLDVKALLKGDKRKLIAALKSKR